ncbi:unnamed protein product [Brassicogethes aeneus]|uniref:Uncharacterized protein n=1 Tax=Brassicogethes aeneus TaxID=1431903 RepID=A0A9P0B4K9_BRAAE|nr:unnamed protein product [Brassicogethes aeneus]
MQIIPNLDEELDVCLYYIDSDSSEQDNASDSTYISDTNSGQDIDDLDFSISFKTYDKNETSLSFISPANTINTQNKVWDLDEYGNDNNTYNNEEDLDGLGISKSYDVYDLNDNSNNFSQVNDNSHNKGYYARKTLRRHAKRCFFNKLEKTIKTRHHQSEGHTLMSTHFGVNDPLRTSGILKTLKADEISLVAKKDKTICEVARKYIKSHKEKHLISVARRNMRRLARLVIEARKIENNNSLTLVSLLHPSKFKVIVQATKIISCYDNKNCVFKSPSLAMQMGTLLKAALDTAYSVKLQVNIDSTKLRIFDVMKKLIEREWATEISTEANHNLNLNLFNKPTLMPVAEDLSKMKKYFDNLISTSIEKLQADNKNESAYKILNEVTYCSLLMFNRRRVGELQRIPLNIYISNKNNKPSGEFERLLSPSEIILIKRLKRIVIKGKRGRGVPVLFDTLTQKGIDIAINHRHNFFSEPNLYLFGLCQTDTCISGYHVFRKHVSIGLGDTSKVVSLTSTKLRKHLATISQILKMGQQDLEQLATFMGHTTKTHNEWYRLPSDVYQTAKVAKL